MPETFECKEVKITRVEPYQRQMTIRDKSSGLDVLLIHISDQLDQFTVYLKAWTDWIKEEDGRYFVTTTVWTLDKPEYHPLRVFGKFFGSKRRRPHMMIEAIFGGLFSRNHRLFNKDYAGASFEELCQNLPGFVEVTEQPQTEGAYQTVNGNSLQTFVHP